MPGLVIGSRRWAIGSDDFIIPGSVLVLFHVIWLVTFAVESIGNGSPFPIEKCSPLLLYHLCGCFAMIVGELIVELCIIRISLRGTILNPVPRQATKPLLIIRIALFFIEILWEVYGGVIVFYEKIKCDPTFKEYVILLKILNCVTFVLFAFSIWCSYDPAGRSWVKMKRFQESLKNPKRVYKRSQSQHRNWRYREAMREYEQSWQNRCRNFFCLLTFKSPRDNSFGDIAKLLSEFFRGLDVVPSDVIAGLSLMRAQQKAHLSERLKQTSSMVTNGERIFDYLSGVPITAKTDFLDLMHPLVIQEVQNLIHYFHYSLAIYGWPMYMVANSPRKWWKLCQFTNCCCPCFSVASCSRRAAMAFSRHLEADTIVERSPGEIMDNPDDFFVGDNCCQCNRAAIEETCIEHNYKIVYLNYEVEVEKPPFFVAVDFDKMAIVISIRGTLSLYDVLTDLNAECEQLPVEPLNEDFYGHKGMVAAASHILAKLREKQILRRASKELKAQDRDCRSYQNQCQAKYPIIVVGHSLGAGTAAILTILLKQSYENVMCFAFAPPGGLLSKAAAEYSKDFVVSVVHGKDCVPRLGLHQMEKMRFDLIKAIKQCNLPKWSIITRSCCWLRGSASDREISLENFMEKFQMIRDRVDDEPARRTQSSSEIPAVVVHEESGSFNPRTTTAEESGILRNESETIPVDRQCLSIHPNDESISLTVHVPLHPPGSIIHLVRSHPTDGNFVNKPETIMQAVWTSFTDYNEILISPTMVRDHMPDQMLKAMKSLLQTTGPAKPERKASAEEKVSASSSSQSDTPSRCQHVETSFACAFDPDATPDLARRFTNLNEDRLRRLRSLVRKGRAPIAEDESWSLEDGSASITDPDAVLIDEDFCTQRQDVSDREHSASIIIDLTNGTESQPPQ